MSREFEFMAEGDLATDAVVLACGNNELLEPRPNRTAESKEGQREPRPSPPPPSVLDDSALLDSAMNGKYTDYKNWHHALEES